jgi:hypothetical protein
MKQVELYGRVGYAVKIERMSRWKAPTQPKLDLFVDIIDQTLEDDTKRLKKQCHTSKRIFERLRDEYSPATRARAVTKLTL